MSNAEAVRIFLPDNSRSVVLRAEEASTLLKLFNGRLFTNGRYITNVEKRNKKHVLTVAYPYPNSTLGITLVQNKFLKIGG